MSEVNRDLADRSSDVLFTYFHSIILIIITYLRLLSQQLGQQLTAIEIALEKGIDETDSVVALLNLQVKAQDAKLATTICTTLAASAPTPWRVSLWFIIFIDNHARLHFPWPVGTITAATQGSSGHLLKCSKCHACGHHADDCRSSNPTAVCR